MFTARMAVVVIYLFQRANGWLRLSRGTDCQSALRWGRGWMLAGLGPSGWEPRNSLKDVHVLEPGLAPRLSYAARSGVGGGRIGYKRDCISVKSMKDLSGDAIGWE